MRAIPFTNRGVQAQNGDIRVRESMGIANAQPILRSDFAAASWWNRFMVIKFKKTFLSAELVEVFLILPLTL